MKTKTTFTTTLFILISLAFSFAQDGTKKRETSKIEQIEHLRNLLLDEIVNQNVKEIFNYKNRLLDIGDNNYTSIYNWEEVLINYWTQEYENIIVTTKTNYLNNLLSKSVKIEPKGDFLFTKLIEISKLNKQELITNIKNSSLSIEDKDFLILNLDFYIATDLKSGISQEYLNNNSKIFLTEHPNTHFKNYITDNIIYEIKPSNWGLGFEFFTGYGFYTENIRESYSNNIALGFALDISYKKYTLYLRDYIGFGKTLVDIPIENNSEVWKKDSFTFNYNAEASLAYDIYNGEKLKCSPFAGASLLAVLPSSFAIYDNDYLEDAGLNFKGAWTLGINFDWKFKKDISKTYKGLAQESYWFVRCRYGYSIVNFQEKYDGMTGNFHYFTIGIGGFGKLKNRAK